MEDYLKHQIENSVRWFLREGHKGHWLNYKHYVTCRYSHKYKGKGEMAKILAYAIKVYNRYKFLGD